MTAIATVLYRGVLRLGSHGEGDDILFLDDQSPDGEDPLAERIQDDIDAHGHYLSVRYWTAEKARDDRAMAEGALRELLGEGEAEFRHAYSEITGYLWTDEEITVGGHDLLAELGSQAGRYCLLEIGYSKTAGPQPCSLT